MILSLRPELVKRELARGTNIAFASSFYVPDFSRPSRVAIARTFGQLSQTGAFGHPELATAEKGEKLFAAAAGEVVKFVREFRRWPAFDPQ
jgi:creatinine amidohydrolase/Fe(II)-dependent formamide hydrolase-like protein